LVEDFPLPTPVSEEDFEEIAAQLKLRDPEDREEREVLFMASTTFRRKSVRSGANPYCQARGAENSGRALPG
jgi:hypothetical protein